MPWDNNDPAKRQRDNQRYGADWRRARLACLERAHWRCEIRLDGCSGAASQVDHILGAANDPKHQHLRAACKPCHAKVTSKQANAARNSRTTDPPCTPRTQW